MLQPFREDYLLFQQPEKVIKSRRKGFFASVRDWSTKSNRHKSLSFPFVAAKTMGIKSIDVETVIYKVRVTPPLRQKCMGAVSVA